jgi:hypothetical protein
MDPPEVVSAEVRSGDGTNVWVTVSETVVNGGGSNPAGWAVTVDSVSNVVTAAVASGAEIQLVVTDTITTGQTVQVTYDSTTGDIKSPATNLELVTFINLEATNNV